MGISANCLSTKADFLHFQRVGNITIVILFLGNIRKCGPQLNVSLTRTWCGAGIWLLVCLIFVDLPIKNITVCQSVVWRISFFCRKVKCWLTKFFYLINPISRFQIQYGLQGRFVLLKFENLAFNWIRYSFPHQVKDSYCIDLLIGSSYWIFIDQLKGHS